MPQAVSPYITEELDLVKGTGLSPYITEELDLLKGTGFSPYITQAESTPALAAEGRVLGNLLPNLGSFHSPFRPCGTLSVDTAKVSALFRTEFSPSGNAGPQRVEGRDTTFPSPSALSI